MIPIRDDNPQINTPFVTFGLVGLNILAWVFLQGLGISPELDQSVCRFGLIPADLFGTLDMGNLPGTLPCRLDGEGSWLTLVSSMFMHGGWLHLLGNMWFLWIFGNNVEDAMGSARFAVFYLLCGLAAATAQIFADASSPVPMVGASGAIGGVMGAYIILYPRVHVHLLIFLGFFITTFAVPAIAMLGYWLIVQLLGGLSSLGAKGGGVAFWAHAGGFAAGAALIFLFKDEKLLARHPYRGWHPRRQPTELWRKVRDDRSRWH